MEYTEPELTYLVLDFRKEKETRLCLESIKKHTKFGHKVIYLHNGIGVDYPQEFLREGLIDQCIQTRENRGLAIGTRDLFAASFSRYSFYLQNDQYLNRDITPEEFEKMKKIIGGKFQSPHDGSSWTAMSVDLAGAVCGLNIYSERGHIIETAFYKKMEESGRLGCHGAGPWHDGPWREGEVQQFYKENKFLHYTYEEGPFVTTNGYRAIRQNPDGSVWEHDADTFAVRLVSGPVKEKYAYPNFTDEEWRQVLATQSWPEWKLPERRHT